MNLKPLIAEQDENGKYTKVSLGRVTFWICFIGAAYFWFIGQGDIQPSHLQMLYITATYNLMKKASFFTGRTGGTQVMYKKDEEDDWAPRV